MTKGFNSHLTLNLEMGVRVVARQGGGGETNMTKFIQALYSGY